MSRQQQWRNAIRDSGLPRRVKLVAWIIDTYLDGAGAGRPSRATIARGACCEIRTVIRAVKQLEQAGFVTVTRSKGHWVNRYQATFPDGVTRDTVTVSNGASDGVTRDTRTRSTELEERARARNPELRAAAGAYRTTDQRLPDITVDVAMLELAKRWLQ
jgi:DNA-binding transcriptional regulator YhcF (GntR family)